MSESFTIPYELVCDANNFAHRINNLPPDTAFSLKSHEIGADREQWFFDCQEQRVAVCVEHLSESAWLEPMGEIPQQRLQNFYKQVICY